jgi:ribonuclease BN (tRNA processing enzyme)
MQGYLFVIVEGSDIDGSKLFFHFKDNAIRDFNLFFAQLLTAGSQVDAEIQSYSMPLEHFVNCIKAGEFSIWWARGTVLYGIKTDLDAVLAAGKNVMIRIHSAILPEIRQRYPECLVIALMKTLDSIDEIPKNIYREIDHEYKADASGIDGTFSDLAPDHIILIEDEDLSSLSSKLSVYIGSVIKNHKVFDVTIVGDAVDAILPRLYNGSFMVRHACGDILIDAAPGLTQSFVKRHFDIKKLLGIIVTHDHIDHFLGLGVFLHYFRDQPVDLPIYAPTQTLATLRNYFSTLRFKRMSIAIKLHLMPIVLVPGTMVTDLPGFYLTACPATHSRDTIALRIQDHKSGAKVVFSSDTAPSGLITEFMAHSDLLFHDCQGSHRFSKTFTDAHSSSFQAGQAAQTAMVRRLVLTHYDSRFYLNEAELIREAREVFSGPVSMARYDQIYTV